MRPGDVDAAVGVLARGMRDNPLHVAAYGEDPERRLHCHGRLMRALLGLATAMEPICAVRDGVLVGFAGQAPAGTCQPSGGQRLRMVPPIVSLGPRTAVQVGKWLAAWSARDPDEPHVHLGPVAVDAHLQRQGLGSLLMAEHSRRLDSAGQVGYLETDKAENVSFYERFGYETLGGQEVIGVPNWFMRREPRP